MSKEEEYEQRALERQRLFEIEEKRRKQVSLLCVICIVYVCTSICMCFKTLFDNKYTLIIKHTLYIYF